ncbi:hypothetical protein D7X74_03910 [Corallococcus sp. CA047B]|uniref:hypothetical protein n=1 Tax=Corallococcus sp. CA047B TaxID=2316729 RepID=UPI000EA1F1DE|nr:hypothetical protein [Corallococcus sp. CA047B]RKH20430.1 hypothetical protein D7X74_03910 [Corallococcus sp. CA047B]
MVSIQKLGLLLSLVSTSVFAQEGITTGSVPVARRNVVSLALPLEGLYPQLAIEGERVLDEHVSVSLGVFGSVQHDRSRMDDPPEIGFEGTDTTQYRVGLAPAVRFYLSGTAPQGLWVSPRLELSYGRQTYENVGNFPSGGGISFPLIPSESETWSLGGMALVGYSVVLEPGFTVQAGVGLGARRDAVSYDMVGASVIGEPPVEIEMQKGHRTDWSFTQRVLVNLGWAF